MDYAGTTSSDDVCDLTIKSADKCMPNGGFDLPELMTGHKCSDILYPHGRIVSCSAFTLPIAYFSSPSVDLYLASFVPPSCMY